MTVTTRRLLAGFGIALWLGAASASAQVGGASGGGSPAGGGSGGGSTGGGGGSFGGGTGGEGGGTGGGTGGAGGTGGGTSLRSGSGSGTGGSSSSGTDATNFLSPSFSNPLYMGRPNQPSTGSGISGADAAGLSNGTTTNAAPPGGFGQPSFGTSSGTTRTGATGPGGTATTTTGPRAGGAGTSMSSGLQQMPSYARIHYSTVVKFPVRLVAAPQLAVDLRNVLDRSTQLSNPGAIQVLVNDNTVTLTGRVRDEDERRLVEGMIRLTPGVRNVNNDLAVTE